MTSAGGIAKAACRVSGQTAIDLGHKRGSLLMAREDELDGRPFQRHHEVRILFAGHTKNVGNAFLLKAANEEI